MTDNSSFFTGSPLWQHGRNQSRSLVDPELTVRDDSSYYPGLSILEARINSNYLKWDKGGLVTLKNREEMASMATALAIHQFSQKYPLEIGPDVLLFDKTVQAQTAFHAARKALQKSPSNTGRNTRLTSTTRFSSNWDTASRTTCATTRHTSSRR